jgi:hypothetical protein
MGRSCPLLFLLVVGCVQENGDRGGGGPSSLHVTITDGDTGAAGAPLPFSIDGVPFTLDIEAIDLHGDRDTSFAGFIRLEAEPGDVTVTQSPEGSVGDNIKLAAGVAENVRAQVARAYGESYLWAEDVGFVPVAPGATAACSNRKDDDGDGLYDFPADPGCFYENDDSEEGGGYATGLSQALHFANPTLADIQGHTSQTPLSGAGVTVDVGDPSEPSVVVTRLAVDGMYLSDLRSLDDAGHIFAFNFSTPQQTRICDRLARLDGIVSEFFGFTEINFPSWQVIKWEGEAGDGSCPVPEPKAIDATLLGDALAMESYESGLIRIQDAVVAPFTGCDVSGDPSLTDRTGCSPKCACTNAEAVAACPTLDQYCQFDQWTAHLDSASGPAIFIVSASTVPGFDPTEHQGETIASITGTMRQIQFIDPPWILEPRCPADFVTDGDPVAMDEACVTSRTEDPDEN